ncbi:elongation factor G [Alginatibacterium sediminis]|uniref:Elongation factor G n=1 Tax=Alginatibacterium sediminis TaxID=2164068 RepID=A0A420E708_9ALTE|nr:elongation factor G [Alginatibacterium sediminis]RKF14430.1 elongation factor G [Alginatibacterium sediminis]
MSVENIRNIAFTGPSGGGKTSLVERLLFESNNIDLLGDLSRGTTVTDFDSLSIAYQHSVEATPVNLDWQGKSLHIIDTPGNNELLGRSFSVLPAVETVALIIDPDQGFNHVCQQIVDQAKAQNKCLMLIINKLDAKPKQLESLVVSIREKLGQQCLEMNLPSADGEQVVDCFFEVDDEKTAMYSSVEIAHQNIVEQVIESDEALLESYLEQQQSLNPAQLHEAFEKVLCQGDLVPICFCSAKNGLGSQLLLRILSEQMPSPAEANLPQFVDHNDQAIALDIDDKSHLIAHVFKISVDPYLGKLAFVRVFQGELKPETQYFVGQDKKQYKAGHLWQMQGKTRKEISQANVGDICVLAKADILGFDSVLHDSHEQDGYHLSSLKLPAPMLSLALAASNRGAEQKLSDGLKKVVNEDPSLRLEHRLRSNETILSGVGEFHLKLALQKLREQYKIELNTALPSIEYSETIIAESSARYRHKKQSGGAGQFAEVELKIRPLERGKGLVFINTVVGGAVPASFIPAVEKGVRNAAELGVIAGYPIQDLEVELCDGKFHSVDSKEIAFVSAGRKALVQAALDAGVVVLEPIVDLLLEVPNAQIGDVSGDINARRGMVTQSLNDGAQISTIMAKVPLSEMEGYTQQLKALTHGEGQYQMSFSHREPVPGKLQSVLVKQYKTQAKA